MPLDIHPANDEERMAAFANVHDVWSKGLPMQEHLVRRAANPTHQRARWYVGCLDGVVVGSLGAQPLEFCLDGQIVPGIGIGSVHTLPTHRGHGYAPQLLEWVEKHEKGLGSELSILYSDIDPRYYTRLGYTRCPANLGQCQTDQVPSVEPICDLRLEPCSARENIAALTKLYHDDLEQLAFSIHRPREYWEHLFARRPDDEFLWLVDQHDESVGFVRLGMKADALAILDLAMPGWSDVLEQSVYALVIQHAAARGIKTVGTWIPDSLAAKMIFKIQPRQVEVTMVKSLSSRIVDSTAVMACDRFAEIDHV